MGEGLCEHSRPVDYMLKARRPPNIAMLPNQDADIPSGLGLARGPLVRPPERGGGEAHAV
jgi:hypothetical protein